MKRFAFIILIIISCQLSADCCLAETGTNRAMWASINTLSTSIYPTSDTEYKPALGKILVSWRMLPTDTYETAFDLYRQPEGSSKIKVSGTNGIINSTCYADNYATRTKDITYSLYYKGGTELLASYTIKKEQLSAGVPYVNLPLNHWDGTPEGFWYKVNDASYGDLDGDGETEIVIKRGARGDSVRYANGGTSDEYVDANGNYNKGDVKIWHTTMWEAYKLDGTLLWRILSGPNISTGNNSSFAIYDFDGDGKCEFVTRLSEGAVLGDGKVITDADGNVTDYRPYQKNMHIHGEPEYLCVIDGTTGAELTRADYIPKGLRSEAWGDDYWKRAASIRTGVIRCAPDTTSILCCRGVYARSVVEVWDYIGGELKKRWSFDTNKKGCANYAGQGYHSLFVGDVDDDGMDEMCYGSMTLDHDGTPLYVSGSSNGTETVINGAQVNASFTGYGHGDALHMGDFDLDRPGLEIWSSFETGEYGAAYRDARTGETIWCVKDAADVGRCSIADIFEDTPGCEMWCYKHNIYDKQGNEIKTDAGSAISPPADNFAVWFTGSLNRQLMDGTKVCVPNRSTGKERRPLRAGYFDAKAVNGSKNNPCLSADLLGDWREEIILVDSAENNLKIFSTWYPTDYRFPHLTSDHHYEMSALNQNIGYNQPTEMGTYLGSDLLTTVTFNEVNGLKPLIYIYVDSLYKCKAENGKLIRGRSYYLKASKSGYQPYYTTFTVTGKGQTVDIDLVNGPILRGDANGDKVIDVADITTIASYILGTTPEGFKKNNADANGDGKIDVADITATAGIILN